MKKTILTIATIIVIVVTIICVKYSSYMSDYNSVLAENAEFEEYTETEIYGTELATLINKAIDKNTKNKYKEDYNSIEIEIYMIDNEQTYKMEAFYNSGIEQFMLYYRDIKFKCSQIKYNEKTKEIQYLLFEQLPIS